MEVITATATTSEKGPLTKLVEAYSEAVGRIAAQGISSPADWEPLSEYIATAEFRRVGAYLEELDWDQYCRFMTDWAGGGTRFEMDMFRIRSEEHTSELQSLMRISYAVFCLKTKTKQLQITL